MHNHQSYQRRCRAFFLALVTSAVSLLPLVARAFPLFGNSATSGPDLVHLFEIDGPAGTFVKNYTVSTGNGRGVVVVDNIIYSTESGPAGSIFGGSNIIYKTDRNTGEPLGTIVVAGLPPTSAMSTLAWDGSHFWTTEYLGGNHAYRIDTLGNIVKTITLSLASSNMDGLEFFNDKLICNRGDSVGPYDIYDLDGNVLQTAFISASSSTTGIAFDGTNFYTSNIGKGTISVWEGMTGTFLYDIALSGGPFNIEDLSVDYATRPDTGGGGSGPGPIGKYYITAGQQGVVSVAQVDKIVSQFPEHVFKESPGQYAISVLNTLRIMGASLEGVTTIGSEYTLDGVYTGTDYPFPLAGAAFWDGATDGTSNYSVDYHGGGVYKFNADWANPTLLFATPPHYLGITFDESNNTLWISQWDKGVVEHRSLDGAVLFSFEVPFTFISCLALDPADKSLWMGSQNTPGTFYQYTQRGTQVRTRDYAELASLNTLGGEFPSPFVAETPPPAPKPTPTVTVSASPSQAAEGNAAAFTVTRSVVSEHPLVVSFNMGSKPKEAKEGSDYILTDPQHEGQPLNPPGRITIPGGAATASVTLNALIDHVRERNESATMTLLANPTYNLPKSKKATIKILNVP